jgi:hypothetical protein
MASTDELDRVARTAGIPMDELQYGLHASGEIHCITPTSLQFNFYSGTYRMKRAIPKRREKYEMGLMTRLMQTIDQAYTPDFKFTPFIVQEALPITQDQIAHLKRKEIPVFGFDTQAQCRTMRTNVLRHKNVEGTDMSRAQMDETYRNIVAPLPAAAAAAASMSRQMPLHAMSTTELRSRATELNLPVQPDHDRATIIQMIQQSTAGKGGGKKRRITLKKRKHH